MAAGFWRAHKSGRATARCSYAALVTMQLKLKSELWGMHCKTNGRALSGPRRPRNSQTKCRSNMAMQGGNETINEKWNGM